MQVQGVDLFSEVRRSLPSLDDPGVHFELFTTPPGQLEDIYRATQTIAGQYRIVSAHESCDFPNTTTKYI